MNGAPAVVVKKGGALSALFYGISLVLTTGIISGSLLGLYGLRIFDRQFAAIGEAGEKLAEALPHWQEVLPPVLADALNDQRAPEYVGQLEIRTRLVPGENEGRQRVLVEVTNRGDQAVSLLTLNLVFLDANDVPVFDRRTFVATPLALPDREMRGPLYPGMQRRYVEWLDPPGQVEHVTAEVVGLRVFRPTPPTPPAPPSAPRGDKDAASSVD